MGLLDMIGQMAAGAGDADHAKVAGGLVQELQNRPGGLGGLIQSFQQNGMGGLIQQWSNGQTQPANPADVETGLGGTGVIDGVAQRTGLSPAIVKMGLAVIMPILIRHLVSNNHVSPDGQPAGAPPDTGGLLQSVLRNIL